MARQYSVKEFFAYLVRIKGAKELECMRRWIRCLDGRASHSDTARALAEYRLAQKAGI